MNLREVFTMPTHLRSRLAAGLATGSIPPMPSKRALTMNGVKCPNLDAVRQALADLARAGIQPERIAKAIRDLEASEIRRAVEKARNSK